MKRTIKIEDLARAISLNIVYMGTRDTAEIDSSDLNRPGLQMSGFFEYFAVNRIQLFGMVEMTYLQTLDPATRMERLDRFFSHPIPCVLIGRNLTPPDEFLDCARKYDVPVLMSGLTTTKLSHKTAIYLDALLAPVISRHGGLMDVYGVGMFITGDSGVGKSETALELVKRGHRFVADDVVEIHKLSDDTLIGQSPDIIRHMMEIRGLGIIDVSVLYGMGSIRREKSIELAIHLEPGDVRDIDRLGTADNHITLLGVKVPQITLPVRPGRNLAIVMEVAAMNFRLKSIGQGGGEWLAQNIMDVISQA
ncbi:HPr(Ser) kinase/phosphatase [Christensenella tenuis]|uniref:HPr kinase/phosphorylase n=1 Tax=Christensenella tenuis TaxID=2763033 RepID=A0ABR7EHZ8_9FIRM|nr:HPr(Ser) kinase/phosphatase [Christensenella tenuis]MBC5649368.1 HPr(Ser) kinase/phosphatase [Christensenella tenuis]